MGLVMDRGYKVRKGPFCASKRPFLIVLVSVVRGEGVKQDETPGAEGSHHLWWKALCV